MKKLLVTALLFIFMFSSLASSAATLYAPDGRTLEVKASEVETWKNVGWYDYPVMKMYAPDCRSIVIPKADCTKWKNAGWYDYPFMYVYAPDGRSMSIKVSDFATWYNVGWSYAPGHALTTSWLTDKTPVVMNNMSTPVRTQDTLGYQKISHCFVPSNISRSDFNNLGVYATYNLNGEYKFLSGTLTALFSPSLKNSRNFNNLTDAVKVEIYADDAKIAETPSVKVNDLQTVEISADVRGCTILKVNIVATGGAMKNYCTYYDKFAFGNVKLYK